MSKWPAMSVDEYMEMATDKDFLGDHLMQTQHLTGASYYERTSSTEAVGHHQVRAAHMVYSGPDLKVLATEGHAHASNIHGHRKIGGVWKFAGLRPDVFSREYDFPAVWDRKSKQDENAKAPENGAAHAEA